MNPLPPALLQRHHRRALWMRPLWVAIAGLTLGLVLIRYDVRLELQWYLLGCTAAAALLLRVGGRRTLRKTASALDAKLALNNRLEAVVELGQRADPLAEAARREVQSFLTAHPWPRPYAWIAGLIILAVLLPTNLAFLIPRSADSVAGPAKIPMKATPPPPVVAELAPAKPPPVAPQASITWVKPLGEITAPPTEEIPLEAEAKSTTGMRRLKLNVALNGETRPPFSIPGEIETGMNPVSFSLALESLEAQPDDIVTYYLQADLTRPADLAADAVWPTVVSPLQIVEIRPLRAELIAAFDSEDPANAVLLNVQQLKLEQFRLLEESFALGHGLEPRTAEPGRDPVQAAGSRQTAMAGEITKTSRSIGAAGIPAEVGELLSAAKTEMEKAAAALARGLPLEAVAPETKAAGRLTAAARIIARTIRESRDRLAAEAATREVPEALEDLPARESTLAGQLEKLAAEQQTLAGQLASQTAPPEAFETQDRVARAVAKLAADPAWPKAMAELLNSAAAAAKESAGQLNEKDALAAMEPATRAAQSLAEAVANMEARGRERAAQEFLAAQQTLNRAATDLQMATAAEQSSVARKAAERTSAVQQDLQAAARRQQQIGAADAAQNLHDLARRIAASDVKRDLQAVAQAPPQSNPADNRANAERASQKLRDLAQQAADAARGIQQNDISQEQAIAELRRAQENLNRIAGDATRPLRWLNPTSEITAEATASVPLVAQANSEQTLSRLVLQLTVNGNRRPPLPVRANVDTLAESLPITLALETLRVKDDDVVSYMMTAERMRPSTDGTPPKAELISTRVQLITIAAPEKKSDKPAEAKPPREAPGGDAGAGEEVRARPEDPMARLIAAQRELVERTFTLEQSAESPKGPAWQASVGTAEKDQRKNRESLESALEMVAFVAGNNPDAMSPTMEDSLKQLNRAKQEMTTAEAALKEKDPAAAAPPSVRALAALVKAMQSQDSPSGGPGASPGSQPPPPSGSPGDAGGQPPSNAPPPGPGAGDTATGGPPQPLGSSASNETTDLFETVVEAAQRAIPAQQQPTGGMPPPPGPGSKLKEIREYAGMLSQRIDGLIEQATAAENQRKRAQILTTANPSEAPPAYRPSVEDYFEKLARDRAVPVAPAR